MKTKEITIDENQYNGLFNLNLTINSGQTSQPPLKKINDNTYQEILLINNHPVLTSIQQEKQQLNITYSAQYNINEEELLEKIYYMFDLDYDLKKLYKTLKKDKKLVETIEYNKGLRLYKAQNPYECIISSISSANNSIKRWTQSINKLRHQSDKKYNILNNTYYLFPTKEQILKLGKNKLEEAGLGYRTPYILETTKMLQDTDLDKKINKEDYQTSYKKLLELKGVGSKVADCILLYGYGKHEAYPVDVWINRITTYLYFENKKQTNTKIRNFAMKRFEKTAGYTQLYLFNYARKSGLDKKIKKLIE
ncbi:MAG: DNA glycosylase [Methanobacteriaceae archaeon]|nr:DNA glycosylase [Methanobacteriaceae archaeon]